MRVHIVTPDLRAGDAVGNHCLHLADALSARGFQVNLYAQRHNIEAGDLVHDVNRLLTGERPDADDLLLLSFSTFQPKLAELMDLPCRKLAYFHGITPVELLLNHDPAAAYWSSRAILQLPLLARCEHLIANSYWNLAELLRHLPSDEPAPATSVIPPIIADMPLLRRKSRALTAFHSPLRLLTVGRLAPHKRIEDAIHMVASLRARGVPVEIDVVGSTTSADYLRHLQSTVSSQNVSSVVRFHGHVTDDALSEHYLRADVLLTASVHEGFCIPVLEAMQQGILNLLRRGTAASEVAAGACVDFASVDEGVSALLALTEDAPRLRQLTANGLARAQELIRNANLDNLLTVLAAR